MRVGTCAEIPGQTSEEIFETLEVILGMTPAEMLEGVPWQTLKELLEKIQ